MKPPPGSDVGQAVDGVAALTGQGITWNGMRLIEPRMEQAFISLIHREEAAHRG